MARLSLVLLCLAALGGSARAQYASMGAPASDTSHSTAIDVWTREGGFARSLALGAGGFGVISPSVQGSAVGIQSYIANPYLIDPIAIIINPAWVSHYKDCAWLNVAPQYAEVGFGLPADFAAGVMLAKRGFPGLTTVSTADSQLQRSPAGGNARVLDNTIYAFAAKQLAQMSVGVGVSWTSAGYDNEAPDPSQQTTHESVKQFSVNGGVLIELSRDAKIDGAVTLMMPSYSYETSQTIGGTANSSKYSDSRTILAVNGRLLLSSSPEFIWVPMVDFYSLGGSSSNSLSGAAKLDTTINAPSHTSIDAGLGVNYLVGNLLLVGGMSLGLYSQTATQASPAPDLKTSQFLFPRFNLGAEWRGTHWLKVRVGYGSSNGTQSSPGQLSPDGKSIGTISTTVRDPYFSPKLADAGGVSVGIGVNFDHFYLDASAASLLTSAPVLAAGVGFTFGTPHVFQ